MRGWSGESSLASSASSLIGVWILLLRIYLALLWELLSEDLTSNFSSSFTNMWLGRFWGLMGVSDSFFPFGWIWAIVIWFLSSAIMLCVVCWSFWLAEMPKGLLSSCSLPSSFVRSSKEKVVSFRFLAKLTSIELLLWVFLFSKV